MIFPRDIDQYVFYQLVKELFVYHLDFVTEMPFLKEWPNNYAWHYISWFGHPHGTIFCNSIWKIYLHIDSKCFLWRSKMYFQHTNCNHEIFIYYLLSYSQKRLLPSVCLSVCSASPPKPLDGLTSYFLRRCPCYPRLNW